MKRYIEIVYDNSGSMNDNVQNRRKYQVAQELFEQVILPTIGLQGDEVVLRLLGHHCHGGTSKGYSLTSRFGNDRRGMLQHLQSIDHSGITPLIYTICDAVDACRAVLADEYLIFVLTDGDDTCGVKINDLISQDIIDKYIKYYQVLFAQLAVESALSRNNLTAIATRLGGQAVQLDGKDTIETMKEKLKKALYVSGFSTKLPLEYCFNRLPGFDMTWEDVENAGIQYHQATILNEKGLLSWKPVLNQSISRLQFAELKFLFGIYFKTDMPLNLMRTMLTQLKKPYYYSHDCIYWDFTAARWKYFKQPNQIEQLPNPEAMHAEGHPDFDKFGYRGNQGDAVYSGKPYVYRVEMANTLTPAYCLKPIGKTEGTKILNPGDHVIFERS
jgi:hypothetical protein